MQCNETTIKASQIICGDKIDDIKVIFLRQNYKKQRNYFIGYSNCSKKNIILLEKNGYRKCVRGDETMWLIKLPPETTKNIQSFSKEVEDEEYQKLYQQTLHADNNNIFGNLYQAKKNN